MLSAVPSAHGATPRAAAHGQRQAGGCGIVQHPSRESGPNQAAPERVGGRSISSRAGRQPRRAPGTHARDAAGAPGLDERVWYCARRSSPRVRYFRASAIRFLRDGSRRAFYPGRSPGRVPRPPRCPVTGLAENGTESLRQRCPGGRNLNSWAPPAVLEVLAEGLITARIRVMNGASLKVRAERPVVHVEAADGAPGAIDDRRLRMQNAAVEFE